MGDFLEQWPTPRMALTLIHVPRTLFARHYPRPGECPVAVLPCFDHSAFTSHLWVRCRGSRINLVFLGMIESVVYWNDNESLIRVGTVILNQVNKYFLSNYYVQVPTLVTLLSLMARRELWKFEVLGTLNLWKGSNPEYKSIYLLSTWLL